MLVCDHRRLSALHICGCQRTYQTSGSRIPPQVTSLEASRRCDPSLYEANEQICLTTFYLLFGYVFEVKCGRKDATVDYV